MNQPLQNYLMVLRIPAYRTDAGHFAIESAFAAHLKMMREKLGNDWLELVVAAPTFDAADYERSRAHLAVIDEAVEGIRFVSLFPSNTGKFGFMRHLPRVWRELWQQVGQASVVHASTSDLFRPFEFPALIFGRLRAKKTICMTDIDNRRSATMNYMTGHWTWLEYWNTRLLHEPWVHLQHKTAARTFSLVLLKGVAFAADYAGGRQNVKPFLDSAFSRADIITPSRMQQKVSNLLAPSTPIQITYFGRLVDYKGVDHMLRAVAHAKAAGLDNFYFQIIGDGESRAALEALARDLDLGDHVGFVGAVRFGSALFERLYGCHVLLAAPLSEDTPRSALDAMASGQAILAYDTYYYRDLRALSGAVETVPWRDEAALGQRLVELCSDRPGLVSLMTKGVAFANTNTQEVWLDRRLAWTRELIGNAQNS